jgi:hypothetical protein
MSVSPVSVSGIEYSFDHSAALVTYQNRIYTMSLEDCSSEEKATELFIKYSIEVVSMHQNSAVGKIIDTEDGHELYIHFIGHGEVLPGEKHYDLVVRCIQELVKKDPTLMKND